MLKKIVITRPKEQAHSFVESLCNDIPDLNFCDFLFEPVLSIQTLNTPLPNLDKYDGVIVTSQHALKLIQNIPNKDVFCVGNKYPKAAAQASTASDLVTTIIDQYKGELKRLLYMRGADVSTDIKMSLDQSGFTVDELIVYEAVASEKLSQHFLDHLKDNQIDAITFFSVRSAEIFFSHIEDVHMSNSLHGIKALCISDGVLEYVQSIFDGDAYAADFPDALGMVRLIQERCT